MRNFFKNLELFWEFKSILSKNGFVLIGLSLLLVFISFIKGIQILMFVPAFVLSLFLFSLWDYFLIRRYLKIIPTTQHYFLKIPENLRGFFFKLSIKTDQKQYFVDISNTQLFFDIPKNTQQVQLSCLGRLNLFRYHLPLPLIHQQTKNSNLNFKELEISIKEYQAGEPLKNIDVKRSSLQNTIYLRDKFFVKNNQKKPKSTPLFALQSNTFLQYKTYITRTVFWEWLLIFTGFLGIYLQWPQPIFAILFLITFFPLAYFSIKKKQPLLSQKWLNPVAISLFLISSIEGMATRDAVMSGAHFLLFLAILKHAFPRERRDGFTYIFLILFVFVALSLYSLSAWFLFLFLAYFLISSVLFSLFSGGEIKSEYASKFGIDYSKIFLTKYLFFIFSATFLLFWILPHGDNDQSSSDILKQKSVLQTGFTDKVELNDVGSIKEDFSKKIVINNASLEDIPLFQNFYWRGSRFHQFDGVNWSKSTKKSRAPFFPRKNKLTETKELSLKFYARNQKNVFLPAVPVHIKPKPIYHTTPDKTIFELRNSEASDFFLTGHFLLNKSKTALQDAYSLPSKSIYACNDNSCQLPKNIDAMFTKFWNQIPAEISKNPRELSNYISEQFNYSLKDPATNINDFLYGSQQGHCEYFATTLAVTLLHFGHPSATLVNGFYGGSFNETAQAWIVRNQNAHSWVEIWENNQWMTLDPTPSGALTLDRPWFETHPLTKPFINFYDAIELRWNQFFVEFTGQKQKELFAKIGSFWPFYLGLFSLFIFFKISQIFWKHFKLSPQQRFLNWLQKVLKEDSPIFLEKYEKKHPQLVSKTRGFLYGNDFNVSISELKKLWKLAG